MGSVKEKIIVALDVPDLGAMRAALDRLSGVAAWCKIGMELFSSAGPDAVREAAARGFRVFLDLKFHDIPNTVAGGVRSARALGVDMLTIHLTGGPEMVRRAVEAAGDGGPLVLGVSVLTSTDAATLESVGVPCDPAAQVRRLVRMGVDAGVRGVVCSPLEIGVAREIGGAPLVVVTPGVRPAGSARDDQSRVASPGDAVRAGADYVVVGRPVMAAPDPLAAFASVEAEIAAAL